MNIPYYYMYFASSESKDGKWNVIRKDGSIAYSLESDREMCDFVSHYLNQHHSADLESEIIPAWNKFKKENENEMMKLPLRDFTDKTWVYEQYRQERSLDFEVAAVKGARVAIHHFEGVEQPVLYDREHARALPHYSTDTNDAMELFLELPRGAIYQPSIAYNGKWRVTFEYNEIDSLSNEFGDTLPETICKAWLSLQAWRANNG